jgi:hypothetical protein
MNMVTLTEQQLRDIVVTAVKSAVRPAVTETLESLGIRPGKDRIWMSQSEASRLVGRRRLERAIREGRVEWEKLDMGKRQGRVSVRVTDVQNLIKQPI